MAKATTLKEALRLYRAAIRRYEQQSPDSQTVSYSGIELAKLQIADVVLRQLGIRTAGKSPKR